MTLRLEISSDTLNNKKRKEYQKYNGFTVKLNKKSIAYLNKLYSNS